MKKKYIMVGIIGSFIIISGICYSCAYDNKNTSEVQVTSLSGVNVNPISSMIPTGTVPLEDTIASNSSKQKSNIYVHICGAVKQPGVYEVDSGARLFDLIKMSGGLHKEAAGDYINQAQPVTDGQRFYIPTKEEIDELSAGEYIQGDQAGKVDESDTMEFVNLNTANAEELMNLPGIGQAKADSIIEYRRAKGNFQAIEELMNIPGIKEGLFNQVAQYIIVN